MKNRILVLNKVSSNGLKLFDDTYQVGQDVANPEAIIVRSARVDTDQYPNLVAVARAGAGVNNISVAKATEKGVCVFNTPGANANAVAELVFYMLGVHARHIDQALMFTQGLRDLGKVPSVGGDDASITTEVETHKSKFTGFEIAGKTLGVIGLGKIGTLVANAGIKSGMKVFGYDAFPTLTNMHQLDSRVEIVRCMEEVIIKADVLSVHVPLSDKTRNLIGEKQIAVMKPDCILMNYARDGIYDNAAVLNAINLDKLGALITDFPTKALLASNDNRIILTPHLGASTNESEENCAVMAVKQLKNYLEYGVVNNSVNFPVMEVFPSQAVRTRLVIVNKDVPNMIAVIAGALGEHGINILAMENKSNGKIGYNLVDLEVEVYDNLIERIRQLPNILQVRMLKF